MNIKIKLPVINPPADEETDALSELIDNDAPEGWKLKDGVNAHSIFYSIDNLTPYFEGGTEYTIILSGGHRFYSRAKIGAIEKVIDQFFQVRN